MKKITWILVASLISPICVLAKEPTCKIIYGESNPEGPIEEKKNVVFGTHDNFRVARGLYNWAGIDISLSYTDEKGYELSITNDDSTSVSLTALQFNEFTFAQGDDSSYYIELTCK